MVVADARVEHGISRPRPGWAEQDAERDWWGGALEVCRRVLAGRASRVRAVGVSALGPCVLAADEGGRPLRPAILYGIDSRAGAQVERLTAELGADEILARCGSRLSSQSAGPKIRWLADEEPGVWARPGASSARAPTWSRASPASTSSTTTAPVTGLRSTTSTPTPGSTSGRSRSPRGWRCPGWSGPRTECGAVSREAAAATGLPEGTPVAAGSIDSWCEVAASGLRGPGEGLLVYGTSMFLVEVHSPARPDPRLWSTVGFAPGSLNIAAGVASAGALTSWLRDLDRRGSLRDAVRRGRRSRTRGRRPPRAALLRRRAHAACSTRTFAARCWA